MRIRDLLTPEPLREGEGLAAGGDGGAGAAGAAAVAPVEFDFGDAKFSLDPQVAERVTDLRTRAEKAAAFEGYVPPESYALTVPKDLEGRIEVSADHPLYKPATEWARKWNLPQAAFDELVGIQASAEAAGGIDPAAEKSKLLAAFNEGGRLTEAQAQEKANEVGRWAAGLLGPDLKKNPGLGRELLAMASTADGVMLLNALKSKVGVVNPPKGGTPPAQAAISTEEFYKELFRKGG